MMFLFLQSLRNNVALTPSEIPMDEFKNIAAPLEIPMISSSEKYYGWVRILGIPSENDVF